MKKFISLILCLFCLFSLVSCAETPSEDPDEIDVFFEADLNLEVLEEILLEKGDAMLATDIPEKYMYIFYPIGVIAQIIYPIDENTSFSILAVGDGTNVLTLTVKNGDTSTDYIGAEDILQYIASTKHTN